MAETFIGAGGWAYFRVPSMDSLRAYAQVFDFAEVNSTFYSYPSLRRVRSWRDRTSPGFRFAVRSHYDLTHRAELQPVPEAFQAYERMMRICRILGADILHLLTPASMEITDEKAEGFRRFFNSVDMGQVRVAWEARSSQGGGLSPKLAGLMKDLGIVHCVDISREEPAFESDLLYTRLFGKGAHNVYQFSDRELREISQKVDEASRTSYLAFHGVRMYADAARLKLFRQTGSFPKLRGPTGIQDLLSPRHQA